MWAENIAPISTSSLLDCWLKQADLYNGRKTVVWHMLCNLPMNKATLNQLQANEYSNVSVVNETLKTSCVTSAWYIQFLCQQSDASDDSETSLDVTSSVSVIYSLIDVSSY